MKYLGDYAASSTLYFEFSTHKADGTPITLAGTPAVSIYKDDGTTESTTGVTLTVDHDSRTGMHNVKVVLSDASFYATGHDYSIVITTGTVDSVSVVGYVLANFSIENRKSASYATNIAHLQADITSTILGRIDAAISSRSSHSPGDVKTAIEAAGSSIAEILTDTGTTLDTLIKDIPTNSEFEARTLPSASYALEATLTTIDGLIDSILADTNELQGDITNGGRIDALIDAIKTKTDLIPANPAAVGSAMTVSDKTGFSLTSAYDNAKTAWSTLTAQQVWEYGTRSLTSFGSLIADFWNTLTSGLTTEGSIGKLFVDNIDAKVSDASAPTAQEMRDALKLAPSAGAAATDSIDDKLDNISVTMTDENISDIAGQVSTDVVASLGAQTITVVSPLISAGTIQIVPGDTYNPDKSNRLIRFTNTGTWSNLSGATVTIEWTGTGTATCEIVAYGDLTTEQIIDVPLSSANTTAMEAGPFKIYATWASPADKETLVIGQIVLSGDVL